MRKILLFFLCFLQILLLLKQHIHRTMVMVIGTASTHGLGGGSVPDLMDIPVQMMMTYNYTNT